MKQHDEITKTNSAETATNFTSDVIQGKAVITALHVDSLTAGAVHEFYFQTIHNNLGHYWYVPVTVIKGKKPGPKVLITTGVHGDELNGTAVICLLKQKLTPNELAGTITIVHGINTPGLISNVRGYKLSGSACNSWHDLNRLFGQDKNSTVSESYASLLWRQLLKPNADYVFDLHTSDTGSHFSFFLYADFRNRTVANLAKLLGADIIKMDDGEPGSIETSFVTLGIPAITLELGASERYQEEIVTQATAGIINCITYLALLPGVTKAPKDAFIGNEWLTVKAELGGYFIPQVKVNQLVKEGELVFVQYDPFGNVAQEYKALATGKVVEMKHFPTNEPNEPLIKIIFYNQANATQKLAD